MPNAVNTGFALDMQRKLYRWSLSDKDKIFSDLFNLVCDRRTLMHAWQRLSRNAGSNTPGTDGLTRRKVQEATSDFDEARREAALSRLLGQSRGKLITTKRYSSRADVT